MHEKPLQELLTAHISGSLDDTAREGLASRLEMPGAREQFAEVFDVEIQEGVYDVDGDPELLYQRLMQVLRQKIRKVPVTPAHRVHFLKTTWFKYAAAILIIFGSLAYLWINNRDNKELATTTGNKRLQADVAPGGEKAVLTLADGTEIMLDSAGNGTLAQQGDAQVIKSNGQIVYNLKGTSGKEVMWNTISTPVGGQYQILLPDGSKIWLNASSSITFPTSFMENKRQVTIKGEVYFEVARNANQPFIVDVNGRSLVEVLGTSFNINSYSDERTIKTTLLEGSVKVIGTATKDVAGSSDQQPLKMDNFNRQSKSSVLLRPGEQAEISAGIIVNSNPDIEQALAWKNGLFNFNGADLRSVMRQLERWYDIKVQYRSSASDITFTGKIYRNASLSHVLDMLRKTGGVQFQVDGKTLIVL